MTDIASGIELRTLITSEGQLRLSLEQVSVPQPADGQIVVRVEAAPISPSDLALLLGPADLGTARAEGTADSPVLVADVPQRRLAIITGRLDQSMPAGNEGAGTVIAAGAKAEHLIGKTVAIVGGPTFAQYVTVRAHDALVLSEGVSAVDGASAFVNPMTALGMIETMRREGHTALVHTAAASNLGQMLNKVCLADGIGLVNIVRSAEQAAILRDIGAAHVVDSTSADFEAELTDAIAATGATLAFDAIGGGKLAGQILNAMEIAVIRSGAPFSRYGSSVHKQVYIYGGLDLRPTELTRGFGMSWGIGGWLLPPSLARFGMETVIAMRSRVMAELKTTFASRYTAEISLADALKPEIVAAYNRRATGEKYLILPQKS
ncbi:zinc-binding dehydrogenase [Brevundimonas sp.]|uniref:zinc-binding dehydrogenase n=1 Tax=Brevundimonas sp. TaxID=1871086 RepID=UPI0025BB450B|nr:zinc-binding dehydrogenase [Brevundimonas sp.]